MAEALLDALARRVRGMRARRGWSRNELARRSGLSLRYLARVEAGQGNISVLRLAALASALGTTADALVRPAGGPRELVTLVGLRGAGKSTIGPLLARRTSRPFVEMDSLIQEASGLSLDQLFELHGEAYYRQLEHDTARELVARAEPVVVAAAGGVVHEPRTWRLLREHTTVVWLRAAPEDHWERVVAQGDRRPMADHPQAMEQLRAILAAREPAYAQAHLSYDTSRATPEEITAAIERDLQRQPTD
jgi:XRE family aerobic/anaerobic benzoate catabolism transcriptional regulator